MLKEKLVNPVFNVQGNIFQEWRLKKKKILRYDNKSPVHKGEKNDKLNFIKIKCKIRLKWNTTTHPTY